MAKGNGKRKSNLPTAEDITTPFALRCVKCGGRAVAYPAPGANGVCFCPKCSPAWIESFATFATGDLREERGLPREFTVREDYAPPSEGV